MTSLQELAGDAALLFDPHSVESIAEAIAKMASDVPCRETLTKRGLARLENFKWENAAKAYRAVYIRGITVEMAKEAVLEQLRKGAYVATN